MQSCHSLPFFFSSLTFTLSLPLPFMIVLQNISKAVVDFCSEVIEVSDWISSQCLQLKRFKVSQTDLLIYLFVLKGLVCFGLDSQWSGALPIELCSGVTPGSVWRNHSPCLGSKYWRNKPFISIRLCINFALASFICFYVFVQLTPLFLTAFILFSHSLSNILYLVEKV